MAESTWQTSAGHGSKRRCDGCRVSGEKTRDGAQLRLDKRDSPSHLRHRLAPASSEGEAMAKAGGKKRSFDSVI